MILKIDHKTKHSKSVEVVNLDALVKMKGFFEKNCLSLFVEQSTKQKILLYNVINFAS